MTFATESLRCKQVMIRYYIFFLFLFNVAVSAQVIKTQKDTSYWTKKNTIGFDFSQIAFVNWNAGGNSSISGLVKGNFTRKYEKNQTRWLSELIIRYGLNKQEDVEWRKTDDVFQINSTVGHKKSALSQWFYSAKFNFITQFTNGYRYPNTQVPISKPFAPAYTFLGIGSEYVDINKIYLIYLSPLTMKKTLVLDQRLADLGAFGVRKATFDAEGNRITKGEKIRFEAGILITGQYKKEIMKNITLENRISLYTDYFNNFGNIDIDNFLTLDMKVNEYVSANIGIHIIYDDDIKAQKDNNGTLEEIGPRIQLKQLLGVGLVYNF